MTRAQGHSILVVEDEPSIASFVSMYLEKAGFVVRKAETGAGAIEQADAEAPSLVILDLMLPDLDGIDVCRRIRQRSDVPILMLTARDDDIDKIIGLEVGADDYLTKPFNPGERRRPREVGAAPGEPGAAGSSRARLSGTASFGSTRGGVRSPSRTRRSSWRRRSSTFSGSCSTTAGWWLTRDQLLERVWGYTFAGDTRTVDVHVRQLRRRTRRRLADRHRVGCGLQGLRWSPRSPKPRRRPVRSLRYRIPALFVVGVLVASAVAALLAVRLFQDYTRGPHPRRASTPGGGARGALPGAGDQERRRGARGSGICGTDPRAGDGLAHLLRRRRDLPR